jgi:glutamyl-tRNA synthetase
MKTTVRFAPSPTGLLHVGNARTALVNWLFARRWAGRFLLRFDDTDRERSAQQFADAIEEDLRWLGLVWDGRVRQSERIAAYEAACDRLRRAGRLYPCYETAEELEYKRRRLIARGRPPVYDRSALELSAADRRALEMEGRRPHWRFLLEAGEIGWDDLVRGSVQFRSEHLSDPILIREDGTFLYMLPSTVDDIDLAITHVIRGEDHVANTPVQIQIFRALGAEPPAFAHLPLMTDIAGQGLSKRLGSITLRSLRSAGVEPMSLNTFLARLGTGAAMEPCLDLESLAADFDLARYGRGTPKFDDHQLEVLNARLIQHLPYQTVRQRLADMGLDKADAAFWEAVRPNLHRFSDIRHWYDVCFGDIEPVIDDADFVHRAAELLPPEPWDQASWETWTGQVKEATGRKGKALFMPIRLALTGSDHGPELKWLLPLIGRRTAERRLHGERA